MAFTRQKKRLTPQQALERLKKFCAYQERSHQEVRHKLLELEVYGIDLEEIIAKLIEAGFLNEERFATAFAGGKFRMKHWGRKKIEMELLRRGVSETLVRKALNEIGAGDYRDSLQDLIQKKLPTLKGLHPAAAKQKLSAFLLRKGFEADLVWQEVSRVIET